MASGEPRTPAPDLSGHQTAERETALPSAALQAAMLAALEAHHADRSQPSATLPALPANWRLPDRSFENWKYTSLAAVYPLADRIQQQARTLAAAAAPRSFESMANEPDTPDGNPYLTQVQRIAEATQISAACHLRFCDGVLDPETALPPGLELLNLPAGPADSSCSSVATGGAARSSKADARKTAGDHGLANRKEAQHPFRDYNLAWNPEYPTLRVRRCASPPLVIVQYVISGQTPMICARLRVEIEDGASLTMVELIQPGEDREVLLNSLTELQLGQDAALRHLIVEAETPTLAQARFTEVEQRRQSSYTLQTLSMGARLRRHDLELALLEEGGEARLGGAWLVRGRQHYDLHGNLRHVAPHCQSAETFRGIAADRGKAIFNGRIHIYPHAQKTVADMSNRNLLLNSGAEIYTKPELEIYADDVRCSHGATIGQLDPIALHYCLSRGISRPQAIQMLSQAFVTDALDQLAIPEIASWLRALAAGWFEETGAAPGTVER